MTDYGPLDTAVSKFRAGSPNIAAAFDEVEKILKTVAPPTVTPPPPTGLTPHAPLNLTSGSGFTLSDFLINVNDGTTGVTGTRAVLLNGGPVKNTSLITGELKGGRLCHIYGGSPAVWPDAVLIKDVETHSMYEDLWHLDGFRNVHFLRGKIHQDAAYVPEAGAHCDGIQGQSGDGLIIEGTEFTWPCLPRRDAAGTGWGGGAIFMASQFGQTLSNVTLQGVNIHQWYAGRAVQMLGVSGKIIAPNIVDCGLGWTGSFPGSPPITLSKPVDGGIIELHPGGMWATGVKRSDVYFSDYQGTGWPSYVKVF